MTTSADELAELRRAVRGTIGAGAPDEAPAIDRGWRASWSALAELGLAGFCVPAELGGYGSEVPAAAVAAAELGADLHAAPYPGIIAAADGLARWLPPAERGALAADLLSGVHVPGLALLGPTARITTDGTTARVDGRASAVLGAGEVDSYLVVGSDAMAHVAAGQSRVGAADGFDESRSCAPVHFDGAAGVTVVAPPGGRDELLGLYGLLCAADALGGAVRCHERTTSYAADRVAFGRPIGGFQAVQHRLADHAVTLRGLTLLCERAAGSLGDGHVDAARHTLLARLGVGNQVLHLLHDLLQLTGAVGFTWEYGLHHYERRAWLDARLTGAPRSASRALAVHEGWTAHDRAPGRRGDTAWTA
ncbi:MAG: acyl-CoA/acyl-ACP dehydrogenase [Acidimicrobiales bacterium]|nr:acyl-CoA/acyl-ACP dehydrogenase [Acidimicrobiales bacterium]